jgi:hypothetical protein
LPQCRLDPARIMSWAGHRAAMVVPSFQTPTEAVRNANVTPRYTGTVTSVWFGVQRVETVEVSVVQTGSTPLSQRRTSGFRGIPEKSRAGLRPATPGFIPYRIGSVPHRFRSRPPSAIAMTSRISSGRGASVTETVIASKCGNDQVWSL